MEHIQIDLGKMESVPSTVAYKTYNFVLFVLDIFSRYVFLCALRHKEDLHVANALKYIFSLFGKTFEIFSQYQEMRLWITSSAS